MWGVGVRRLLARLGDGGQSRSSPLSLGRHCLVLSVTPAAIREQPPNTNVQQTQHTHTFWMSTYALRCRSLTRVSDASTQIAIPVVRATGEEI